MADFKTLDNKTIENIFVLIGMIPHYEGQPGTGVYGKEMIVIDDLIEVLDLFNKTI